MDNNTSGLSQILDPNPVLKAKAFRPLASSEVAEILAAAEELSLPNYQMLLEYLRSAGQPWRNCEVLPHPLGALVLPPVARQPPDFKLDGHSYSCRYSHPGNSGIQFKHPTNSNILTGFIEAIWEMPLEGHMRTFILVELHKLLPQSLWDHIPFTIMPLFNTTVVDSQDSGDLCIIEPRHILTHLTVYKRPRGTFGINQELFTICWSLNRGRRS